MGKRRAKFVRSLVIKTTWHGFSLITKAIIVSGYVEGKYYLISCIVRDMGTNDLRMRKSDDGSASRRKGDWIFRTD